MKLNIIKIGSNWCATVRQPELAETKAHNQLNQ